MNFLQRRRLIGNFDGGKFALSECSIPNDLNRVWSAIDFKPEQYANAISPMEVTVFGTATHFKREHPKNKRRQMSTTPLNSIATFKFKPCHFHLQPQLFCGLSSLVTVLSTTEYTRIVPLIISLKSSTIPRRWIESGIFRPQHDTILCGVLLSLGLLSAPLREQI